MTLPNDKQTTKIQFDRQLATSSVDSNQCIECEDDPLTKLTANVWFQQLAAGGGSDLGSGLRRYWSWPRPRSSSAAAANAALLSPPAGATTASAGAAAAAASDAATASSSTAETVDPTEATDRPALPDEVVVTPIEIGQGDTNSRVLIVETYCVI